MAIEFKILGPLEVLDAGRPITVSSRKQRALLALLLLNQGAVVSRDRLIDALWDGEPPATAQSALRVHVSELRKLLEDDDSRQLLVTIDPGYRLQLRDSELDLIRFEQLLDDSGRSLGASNSEQAAATLRKALALWRGPPLADFAYDAFAQQAIGRLEELRLVALERRLDADLDLGRHGDLVPELEGLLAEHPLRERPRSQLMLALYRSGRQADALATYQLARRLMAEELGIEPGRPLQDLEAAILRGEPALDPASAATPPDGAQQASPTGQAVATPEEAPDRSLLVVADSEEGIDALVPLAELLARRPARELILTRIVGPQDDLVAATTEMGKRRAGLTERGVHARSAAFNSKDPGRDVVRLASEQDSDLILMHADTAVVESGTIEGDVAAILETAACDVALVTSSPPVDPDRPVMVPMGGAEHEWTAVELGAWAAKARGVPLILLGGAGDDDSDDAQDASRLLAHASLATQKGLGVDASPMLVAPGDQGVLEAITRGSLLVIGLSERWEKDGLGATRH
ncbi:MAG: AfsR/SARP family transcriptional regulator, partial [Solirubrobacterales bacterium]